MLISKYFLVFSFLLSINLSFSQSYYYYGDKVFGGNNFDNNPGIVYVNNNLLIAGTSSSEPGTGNVTDPSCNSIVSPGIFETLMVMFDSSYNILWDKNVGGMNSEGFIKSILNISPNRIALVTTSNSDISCEKSENNRSFPLAADDYWIYCFDTLGNKIFDKTLGSSTVEQLPFMVLLSDSTFMIVGTNNGGPSGDKTVVGYGGTDYWAVKLDSNGNKIWDRVYGGSANELAGTYSKCVSTENGSFVIAGTTDSPVSGDITQPGIGLSDFWVIKVDSAGNKIWDKRFGGAQADHAMDIIKTEYGFIIIGRTASQQGGDISEPSIGGFDVWILSIDSVGNKLWDKRYGGTQEDRPNTILPAPDGGYWISASTLSPQGFSITDSSFGDSDYWIFKIDSAGNKLFDKRFGGPEGDFVRNFVIMPDSSIFLCGAADSGTSSVKTDPGYGEDDFWVVHFKYGNFTSSLNENAKGNEEISVFPNPAIDEITFKSTTIRSGMKLKIYNSIGQEIIQKNFEKELKLDLRYYKSTIYFYKVEDKIGNSYSGRFIKQ